MRSTVPCSRASWVDDLRDLIVITLLRFVAATPASRWICTLRLARSQQQMYTHDFNNRTGLCVHPFKPYSGKQLNKRTQSYGSSRWECWPHELELPCKPFPSVMKRECEREWLPLEHSMSARVIPDRPFRARTGIPVRTAFRDPSESCGIHRLDWPGRCSLSGRLVRKS